MPAVVLESVSKVFHHRPALFNWFGRERTGETRALDRVSLEVPSGKVLVLLGPNGSGKTTTLKLISTMLLPDSGRILVHGADTTTTADVVRERVGFAGEVFVGLESLRGVDKVIDHLLDRAGPVRKALIARQVDHPHPAPAEQAFDPVAVLQNHSAGKGPGLAGFHIGWIRHRYLF